MADSAEFRAELHLLQQQLQDLSKRHDCKLALIVLHPDGELHHIQNMDDDELRQVCRHVATSRTREESVIAVNGGQG